jgi:hypothetical protein
VTRDDWSEGETGETYASTVNVTVRGETLDEVVKELAVYLTGVTLDGLREAADGLEDTGGYYRWNVLENGAGDTPGTAELDAWKKGKATMYNCDYTIRLEKIEAVEL